MRGKTRGGGRGESPVLSDLIGNFVMTQKKKKKEERRRRKKKKNPPWPVEKVAVVLGGSVQAFSIFFSPSLPLSFSPSLVSKGASGQR